MNNSIFNKYPVAVCAADGTAALLSPMAEELLGRFNMSDGICTFMSDADKVLFDIVMNSTKPRPFTVAAVMRGEYTHISVTPMDVGDMRICVAVFHRESDEVCCHKITMADLSDLMDEIAGSDVLRKYASPMFPLLDIAAATRRIYNDLCERGICDLEADFSDLDAEDRMIPGEMGLQNYIYMMTAAVSAMSELAGRTKIRFSAEESACGFDLKIRAGLSRELYGNSIAAEIISPACRARLAICEAVASNNSLGFGIVFEGDALLMSLEGIAVTSDHDFKSHYRYEGYEEMLLRAISAVEAVSAA